MCRSRLALTGLIIVFAAACSSSGTPPPTGASPTSASAGPTAIANSPAPTMTPSPSSGPTPVTTASGWQRVGAQAALTGVQASLVIWTGQRFLAAATLADGSAAILDSSDGQTWHAQTGFGPGSQVLQLSAGPAGVLAVGVQDADARSWFSTDGLAWAAAPAAAALRPAASHTIRMNAAVPTPSGWLAVGEEDVSCTIDCGSWAAVQADAWTSINGLAWTREPASSALANAGMTGVVRGGPGFVAVGGAPDGVALTQGPVHAVVWTSADGRAWSRIKDAPLFHSPAGTDAAYGVTASAITTDGSRFVAVGNVATQGDVGSALAWWSIDGMSWQQATGDRFLYGQLRAVTSVPGGFLGTGPSGPDSCLGGIWSSVDGRAWSCIAADPPFADFVAYGAAASSTIEVVLGNDAANGTGSIAWTRPLP